MKKTTKNKLIKFFDNQKHIDIDFNYMLDFDEIESFDDIRDQIDNNDGFYIEIIYYYNAMQYLMEHDQSLQESLEIAQEMCLDLDSINSEVLASLLASQNTREEFEELENEVTEILES